MTRYNEYLSRSNVERKQTYSNLSAIQLVAMIIVLYISILMQLMNIFRFVLGDSFYKMYFSDKDYKC